MTKRILDIYAIPIIYTILGGYLTYSNVQGDVILADQQLYLIISIVVFLIGFFSFFNFKKEISNVGLFLMIEVLIMTALYIFL